jgi:hypothetical protein
VGRLVGKEGVCVDDHFDRVWLQRTRLEVASSGIGRLFFHSVVGVFKGAGFMGGGLAHIRLASKLLSCNVCSGTVCELIIWKIVGIFYMLKKCNVQRCQKSYHR